jgi:hypothetical protein
MNARAKKAARFKARKIERIINSALKECGFSFTIRILARGGGKWRGARLAPSFWHELFIAHPESDRYNMLRNFVNRRLSAPGGGMPRLEASSECPTCGNEVLLFSDPHEWQRTRRRRWKVTGYGPATGDCCDNLIVDDFNGCRVLQRKPSTPAAA